MVLITKLKPKLVMKTASCKYKINAGSDGNLMPFSLFELLFLKITIAKSNKMHKQKSYYAHITICAYHN